MNAPRSPAGILRTGSASPTNRYDRPLAQAATAIVWRGAPADPEVLVIRRGATAPFMSGFLAFPGGHVEPTDGPGEEGLRRAAARETREEVALDIAPEALVPAGTWRTPDYLGYPLLTHFFTGQILARGAAATPDGHEVAALAWRRPGDVLDEWEAGRCLLAPPTQFYLAALADGALEAPARLLAPPECRAQPPRFARIRPDITLFPVRTPTLPRATHTNVYVIGRRRLVVCDPGAADPDEQAALAAHLDALIARRPPGRRRLPIGRPPGSCPPAIAEGARLEAILLTHHHADHVGGATALAGHFGVPILAHPETARRVPFPVDTLLGEGDRVPWGDAPLRCLHTPGHAPGHLTYWHETTGSALVGDMVAGVGTIVVDPVEGSMTDYLASLERLRAAGPTALLPAHGGVMGGADARLAAYLHHRLWREARVVEALGAGAEALDALLPIVYADTLAAAWPLARLSLRAHLEKLRGEGRAHPTDAAGERWRPGAPE